MAESGLAGVCMAAVGQGHLDPVAFIQNLYIAALVCVCSISVVLKGILGTFLWTHDVCTESKVRHSRV